MRITRIVPYTYWRHVESGRTVAITSIPWRRESERAEWARVEDGYTFAFNDGTRRPLSEQRPQTYAEALALADEHAARHGYTFTA